MLRTTLPSSSDARRILVGTLFSAIGRGLTLPFLLVYLTEVRGLQAGQVGLLVGWMGAVALALAPLGGSLMDRFGARPVVLPLFLVEAIGTGSLAFVDSTLTAFLALTTIAVGGAALWSGQTTILAALVTPAERQRTFALSFTLLNLGIGAGGVISAALVDVTRPGTFQLIYAGDAISYLIPGLILLSLRSVGRRVEQAADDKPVERGGYRLVLRDRAFVRFFLLSLVLVTCGYAQLEVGFTAFSTQVAGVGTRVLGLAFAGNTVLIVVAQLFVVRWLEGRSRTRALALAAGLLALSWAVLGAAGLAGSRGFAVAAVAGVIGCAVVFAMGETLMSPVLPAITNALAPDELRGRYNALGSMVWGISGVVGPVAAGPLIGNGLAGAWVVLVTLGCLAAALLALWLHQLLTPAQDGRHQSVEPMPATAPGTPDPASAPAPAGV